MNKRFLAAAATGIALAALTAPANAELATTSELVVYGDLNLGNAAAVRTLRGRVARAVQRVCLYEPGQKNRLDFGYRHCANRARDGAERQIARAIASSRQFGAYDASGPRILVTAR